MHVVSSVLNVPGVEASPIPCTPLPLATIPRILFRLHMKVVDVVDQLLQRVEELMALRSRDDVEDGTPRPSLWFMHDLLPDPDLYLHPATGQLTVQRRRWRKRLLLVPANKRGGGNVGPGWTSDRQIELVTLW